MDAQDADAPAAVSVPPSEVFAALGNETRMAILRALWESKVPGEPPAMHAVSFSELQDRVGIDDSGQFTYHLNKLVDRFVEHTEAGYVLRAPGAAVIRAVLKGTLTEDASLADEPIDAACPYCGAEVLTTYRGDMLFFRCSSCEGSYQVAGFPEGVLTGFLIPPVVILNRTPAEVFRDATTWSEHQHRLMMEGICPECAGTITTTTEICSDHDTESGRVCPTCQSAHPVRFLHVCSVCRLSSRLTPWVHVFTDPTVEAFYAEHGFDSFGPGYFDIWPETIEDQAVVAEDPLEVRITIAIDDDRLVVTLDETGSVVEVA